MPTPPRILFFLPDPHGPNWPCDNPVLSLCTSNVDAWPATRDATLFLNEAPPLQRLSAMISEISDE